VPALVAACVGDMTTRALGIVHTHYPTLAETALTPLLFVKWLVFAAAVAAVAVLFIELTHRIKHWATSRIPRLPLRMFAGGCAVVALWLACQTSDYLGLGVPLILRAFSDPAFPVYGFALKLVFTALTLGAGFLGGEVTPIFFIGAALGNVLGRALHIPLPLAAGVGMAALFATASNTPLALSIMAVELLGKAAFPHVAIVCGFSYMLSGPRSIYAAQRVAFGKNGDTLHKPTPLRDLGDTDSKHAQPPDSSG
jgi:H+/Cl- antiporter ClcA